MLISSLSFAFINLMVKFLTHSKGNLLNLEFQTFPPYEIVLFRSIISLSICLTIIKFNGYPILGHNKKWLFIRGFFGASALTLLFYTIQNLPLAIATTVQYLSPIFTLIFAIFLHKQKVKWIQWLFFLISFLGVYIIGFGKHSTEISPFWLGMGILSAVFSGIAYNAILKCKNTDKPITIVMYFPLIATPVMAFFCYQYGFVMPKGIEWLFLLLIGIFTQIAQITMTKAFTFGDMIKVTPIKYLGAIYAACIGLFIFDEKISLILSIGISLILTGVLLNTFYKGKFIRDGN